MAKKKGKETLSDMESILSDLCSKSTAEFASGSSFKRQPPTSTGSIILDSYLDGGYVKGKIIECYGPESSGKSTLGYAFLRGIEEGVLGWVDAESDFDTEKAQMNGVDTDRVIVQHPGYLEEGLQTTLDMINKGVKAVVFDSIAGSPPKAEIEGTLDDTAVGKKAYKIGQVMRQLHDACRNNAATVFFVNQIRASMSMYGSPFTTPGGHALKFHASYRLQIMSRTPIHTTSSKESPIIGHTMKIRIVKHKYGNEGVKVMIPLIYGVGISPEWEIMEIAFEKGFLKQAGSWIKNDAGESICQGKYNCFTLLLDNPDYVEDLKGKISY